jgi:hypothetical protein
MKLVLATLALALSTAALPAQCTLSITGSVNFGQTCTIAYNGSAAGALVLLGASENLGTTSFGTGPLAITLNIAQPMIILPMGTANASGDCSLTISLPASPNLPAGAPTPPSKVFNCQAVGISFPTFGGGMPTGGFPGSFTTCVSNVATLNVF